MTYIFESPDGGETVYRREFGSDKKERWIDSGNPAMFNYGLWSQITKAATEDPVLLEMIDQLVLYYTLKHKDT